MDITKGSEELPFEEALESTWHIRFLRLLSDSTWTTRIAKAGLSRNANIYSAVCYEYPELMERNFIIRAIFNDLYTRGLVNKKFDLIAACSVDSEQFRELAITPLGKNFLEYIDQNKNGG